MINVKADKWHSILVMVDECIDYDTALRNGHADLLEEMREWRERDVPYSDVTTGDTGT